MNTEQERAAFEAEIRENWGFAKLERVGRDYIDPETQGLWGLWNRRAAMQSQDAEGAATEATGGDENGGHRLVEPDHETAMALADAPRSLRNYVAALRSAIALQSQDREDAERYRWLRNRASTEGICVVHIDYWSEECRGQAHCEVYDGEFLDKAIDHARRVEENK